MKWLVYFLAAFVIILGVLALVPISEHRPPDRSGFTFISWGIGLAVAGYVIGILEDIRDAVQDTDPN